MTPELVPTTRLRPAPSVYARAFGAEMVLLEFGRGEYYGLDEVGAVIWRRLEAGDTLGAVADHVATQFDVSRDVAFKDVVDLVAHMCDEALLTVC